MPADSRAHLGLKLIVILCVALVASGPQSSPVQAKLPTGPDRPPRPVEVPLEALPRLADAARADYASAAPAEAEAITDVEGWSLMAFQTIEDNNWEVYLASGSGTSRTRLTTHKASDIYPRLNRGCTRVAFASDRTGNYEIFAMNRDGSGVTQLTGRIGADVKPAWSPDGQRIAFQSYSDGQAEIYVMNADGSAVQRLTSHPAYDGEPTWSPDGKQLAFSSNRSGSYSIWIMDSNGATPRQLTYQPYSENPTWSPDGTRIAYDADGDRNGWQELWVINTNGTDAQAVYIPGEPQTDAWAGSWSPDAQSLICTRISFVKYEGTWYWLNAYMVVWEAGNASIVAGRGTDWAPDWQTVDAIAPITSMYRLPAVSPYLFRLWWDASDEGGSGLRDTDIEVRVGSAGPWVPAFDASSGLSEGSMVPTDARVTTPLGTDAHTTTFWGTGGQTYYFRIRAYDSAYNIEPWPTYFDAWTMVEPYPPETAISALPTLTRGNRLQVGWAGTDPGGSGIESYDVQYRLASDGVWQDWCTDVPTATAFLTGTLGQTYWFRVRASDAAQNQEPWPDGDGDTFTTLYSWGIHGGAWANTGMPSSATAVSVSGAVAPALSDALGRYRAVTIAASDTHTVSWHREGLGELPLTSWGALNDVALDVVLPPSDNIVTNWGFESGDLTGWDISGGTSAVTASAQHTGRYGLQLGDATAIRSIANLTEPLAGKAEGYADILTDDEGVIHAVWSTRTPIGEFQNWYAMKPPEGPWSAPQLISPVGHGGSAVALAIDREGTLHLVWESYMRLKYAIKVRGGTWIFGPAPTSGLWGVPDIVVDSNLTVHVVASDTASRFVIYSSKAPGEGWSTPVQFGLGTEGVKFPSITLGPDGSLVAVWHHYLTTKPTLVYATKAAGGTWSDWNVLPEGSGRYYDLPTASFGGYADLTTDRDGVIHAVWTSYDLPTEGIVYASWRPGAHWTYPMLVVPHGVNGDIEVISGTLTLAAARPGSDGISEVLFTRHTGLSWDVPTVMSRTLTAAVWPAVTVGPDGMASLVWREDGSEPSRFYSYSSDAIPGTPVDARLTRRITLPATLQNPWLSFFRRLSGFPTTGEAWFSVEVDDGIRTTTLLSTTANGGWTHESFDLSPWKGKAIALSLTLHQNSDRAVAVAYLDEITIGSAQPDVWVSLLNTPAEATPTGEVIHTLTCGNLSPAAAVGVWMTATWPSEMELNAASFPPDVSTATLAAWDVGDLAGSGGPVTVTFTTTLRADAPQWAHLPLTATVSTASTELETMNNVSIAPVLVLGADLWVTADATPTLVLAGGPFSYTLQYGNQGAWASQPGTLVSLIPEGIAVLGANPTPTTADSRALTWSIGALPAHSEVFTIVLSSIVSPTTEGLATLVQTATISSTSPEADLGNNTGEAPIFVGCQMQLPVVLRD